MGAGWTRRKACRVLGLDGRRVRPGRGRKVRLVYRLARVTAT